MEQFITCTRAYFNQIHSKRCNEIRELVSHLQINKVKWMLKSDPFGYNEQISSEVAEGIVIHGDKLVSNSEQEWEDDPELVAINQIGDNARNAVPVTLLEVGINTCASHAECMNNVHSLYPSPSTKKLYSENKTECLGECLNVIESFMAGAGGTGYVAAVVLKTSFGESGVRFPKGCEVPIEVLERHIQHFLVTRKDLIQPMAVHLIIPGVSQIGISILAREKSERYMVKFI